MPKKEILEKPASNPDADVIEQKVIETKEQVEEESQVIVHCSYKYTGFFNSIRIWKSTYLFDQDSDHQSELLHAENIPLYPGWRYLKWQETARFTLVFSGLPKSCTAFDLREVIPEHGGFTVKDIKRNSMDVYEVRIS